MNYNFWGLLFMIWSWPYLSQAQSVNAPLNPDYYHLLERYEINSGKLADSFHSSYKPYQRKAIATFVDSLYLKNQGLSPVDRFNLQYLANDNWEWSVTAQNESENPILNHFYRVKSDFFHVQTEDFDLHINPVLYLSAGLEAGQDIHPYTNTRGVEMRGMISNKLGFYTYLGENQAVYPGYVRTWIDENRVVPNQGFWKNFKENGVDFFTARGYISFDIIKNINLQFGHDRFFIGNGYRSMILSDFSNNYLFLKLNTKVWRLNYTNLFAQLTADSYIGRPGLIGQEKFPRKFMTQHHLSINITDNFNLGVFETIMFGKPDSTGFQRYELDYLNPIIFYRAIEHQSGSIDNAILGSDFKWLIGANYLLYGQLVLDEFLLREIRANSGWWANKYGYQLGLKKTNLFGIANLDLQLEHNMARPFLYAHQNIYTSYTHYRQPLAHPLGANFREYIGILRYQPLKRLALEGKVILAGYGLDTLNSNWGQDIRLSYLSRQLEYGNETGQGIGTDLSIFNFRASYQFRHNLFLEFNQLIRKQSSELEQFKQDNTFTSLALRWNFPQNNPFDF